MGSALPVSTSKGHAALSLLLSTYYVSGTLLSTGNRVVMVTDKNPFSPDIGAFVAGGEGWARAGRRWSSGAWALPGQQPGNLLEDLGG